jgi:hypothetical protein
MHEDIYWQKYAARFKTFPSRIVADEVAADLSVCIPVYAEPDLLLTLDSLWHCEMPEAVVDVLLCFNKHDETTPEEQALHDKIWIDCLAWTERHQKDGLRFRPFYLASMPDPKGGVGLARKIVMDEAARRVSQDAVIVCLDADCTVEANYLTEIHGHFLSNPKCDAVSIFYEHPLDGLDAETKTAIVAYELHLRYLVHALRWSGHPFAYQTVGSSMAVRRSGYLAHGGMNTRRAGEDFYFLQKFIEVGTLQEIRTTTVYPSARISYRVPFGTGRAMNYLLTSEDSWFTTSFATYQQLQVLLGKINRLREIAGDQGVDKHAALINEFQSHPELSGYLEEIDLITTCSDIVKQTASPSAFRKRFFRYFNAFRVIRFTHDMRDRSFPDVPVIDAVGELLEQLDPEHDSAGTAEGYLLLLRKADRMGR